MFISHLIKKSCAAALAIAISTATSVQAAREIAGIRATARALPEGISLKRDRSRVKTLDLAARKGARSKLCPRMRSILQTAQRSGNAIALQSPAAAGSVPADGSGRVAAVIRHTEPDGAKDLGALLVSTGAEIVRSGAGFLKVKIPVEGIGSAAVLPQVRSVRTLQPPRKKAFTAQGVGVTEADTWNGFGLSGAGVDVAIVDTGFMSISSLVSAGELPADYVPVNFSAAPDIGDTDAHGSACAEIVHDIAPAARLHLVKIDDIADLIAVADYCATAGVDIISCSLGFDTINFHDGIAYENWYTGVDDHPVTAVNLANAAGTLFTVAAGNEREQHTLINWGSSGDYMLWGANGDDLNVLYYDYGDPEFPANATIAVLLTWNYWPLSGEDYDLYLYHYNEGTDAWEPIWASEEAQDGSAGSYPMEELVYVTEEPGMYAVSVDRYTGSSAPTFLLRYYGVVYPYYWGYDNYTTPAPGSLSIPGDAAAAFTVGAVAHFNYPGGPVDDYSSLGPNNRAFTGGAAVIKPDLCAPAGITSVAYGNQTFFGTSASTPHAAGLAALVKSAYPYFTVDQLREYLENHCFDIAPAGKDNTNGAGTARLPADLAVIEGEALKATAIAQSGGGALVQFTGLPGEEYTVMARASLTEGTWQTVGTATVAADGTASFTDPGPLPPVRFYKLVKP